MLAFRQILTRKGIFALIGGGGPDAGAWLVPLATPLEERMISPFVSQKFVWFIADLNKEDLTVLGELMQAGKVTSIIDRRYKLSETPEALRYLERGHARGKVVISLE